MKKKCKTLLGFATRAGKTFSGVEQVLKAVRSGKARLVVVAEDASEASKKKIQDKAAYYGIDCIYIETVDVISSIIGKSNRVCVAIIDQHFADCIMKEYLQH